MAGTIRGDGCGNKVVNPARKYIRLQECGLYCFLSWPPVWMLFDMYGLHRFIHIMSVSLIYTGVVVFCIGLVGRQELRAKDDKLEGGQDGVFKKGQDPETKAQGEEGQEILAPMQRTDTINR